MESVLISPANASFLGIPAMFIFLLIPLVAIGTFAYIIAMRTLPLVFAAPDKRFNRIGERIFNTAKYAIAQYKQPRYMLAGVIHILLFAGFCVISLHSITLVLIGIKDGYHLPGMGGITGDVYGMVKDVFATLILLAALVAMVRRGIFKPERYAVPPGLGKDHTAEAVFILGMIAGLIISDALFEGSEVAAAMAAGHANHALIPGTATWIASGLLAGASQAVLQSIHLWAYFTHEVLFFSFLCFLPLGKHFHVITSLPNVFLMRLDKGTVKPVRHGVADDQLDDLESFGAKTFDDFTWKHLLDFYSCADCGRCSDHCPANAAGRPLSPRFISIKCRDYGFGKYPLRGPSKDGKPLVGHVLFEDEIWSCTTCGACEEECPLMIEYIDKIVDVRRGMVDEGMVPQSLQKPLRALEKRGNPWGKLEKKRLEWTKEMPAHLPVKVLEKKETAETLYFVDSITSYDDRMQSIAQATATVLGEAGIDYGVLGRHERDSGHEVRRFGEEMLFQDLKDRNTSAILKSGVTNIVTADPHAYNALKKDYRDLPPVQHISQVILEAIRSGKLTLKAGENNGKVYTYHDPCYLGRHNGLYDDPRAVLDAIPGLKRVDMERCRDRSFCCGGGGLMLFYEPEQEEERMGVLRVNMATEAGANVIVTACPFCLVNIEDGIKVSGNEGKLEAIDLAELVLRHLELPEKTLAA